MMLRVATEILQRLEPAIEDRLRGADSFHVEASVLPLPDRRSDTRQPIAIGLDS
jgi:hypothetical protein